MKSRALFHLLLLRARTFRSHLSAADRARLDAVLSSVSVKQSGRIYKVEWSRDGESVGIAFPTEDFHFYVVDASSKAGETGKAQYRDRNWTNALKLWRAIGATAGFAIPAAADGDPLGFGVVLRDSKLPVRLAAPGSFCLAAALVVGWAANWPAAAAVLCALILQFAWLLQLERTHVGKSASWYAQALIASVTASVGVMPFASSGAVWPGLVLLAGILAISFAEGRSGLPAIVGWAIGGMLTGISAGFGGVGQTVIVVISLALLLLLAVSIPARVSPRLALTAVVLAAIVGGVIAELEPTVKGQSLSSLQFSTALVVASMYLAAFLVWWMYGVLRMVTPWLAMFFVAINGFCAVFLKGVVADQLLLLAGLGLLLLWRSMASLLGRSP